MSTKRVSPRAGPLCSSGTDGQTPALKIKGDCNASGRAEPLARGSPVCCRGANLRTDSAGSRPVAAPHGAVYL